MAMRIIFQRNWARTTFRIRAALPITFAGARGTTIDVSPRGAAIGGMFGAATVGTAGQLRVECDDGEIVRAEGSVESVQRRGGTPVLGVALRVAPADQARWIAQLSRAMAASVSVGAGRPVGVRRRRRERVSGGRVLAATLVGAITAAAMAALTLALLGYRPMVVRSASMEPALRVGDVVLVEDVEARELRPHDIATISDPGQVRDSLTHRVERVSGDGAVVTLVVRGDANSTAETFALPADSMVGKVATRVPAVGSVVVWLGNTRVRYAAAAIGVGALAVMATSGRRRHAVA
jgi:signal peptidase